MYDAKILWGTNQTLMMFISMTLPLSFQSALGWDYQSDLSKHGSQTDATKGFGGRYGVQKDRQEQVSKHT